MAGTCRSGGDRKSRGRDCTKDDGIPQKPDICNKVGRKWDELLTQLPAEALRRIDVHELKLLSELLVMADGLGAVCIDDPADHKSARLFLNVADRIHRLSAAFGLTPADRKRLSFEIGESDEDDPYGQLMAMMTRGRERRGTAHES